LRKGGDKTMWDDRSYDTPINRRFPEASHIDVPEGVTDIGYLELSNYKKLETVSLPQV